MATRVDRLAKVLTSAVVHMRNASAELRTRGVRSFLQRPSIPFGLSQAEPWLRPGDWDVLLVPTSPRGRSSPVAMVRSGAVIPPHIDGPAYTRSGIARVHEFERLPLRIDPSPNSKEFQADVLLIRKQRKWLMFDLERSEVLRWLAEPFGEEYEALRQAFSRHVPSVDFEILSSGRTLREQVAVGTTLIDLPQEHRVEVCRTLLRCLTDLAIHERRTGVESDPLEDVIARSPIEVARRRSRELIEVFGAGPPAMIPVHGDLGKTNVICTPSENLVIDFDDLHLGPFWTDALRVARIEKERWSEGALDDELAALWDAGGLHPLRWGPETVELATLVRVVVSADRQLRGGGTPLSFLKRRSRVALIRDDWERRMAKAGQFRE